MSDESDKEVIWALDKDVKNLTTDERLRQVEEEAEKNYGKREIAEKEDLGRARKAHEERDSRPDHCGPEKERKEVGIQYTKPQRRFAIPHFLENENKTRSKTVARQESVESRNKIFDGADKVELRTDGERWRVAQSIAEKTRSFIPPEIRNKYVKFAGIYSKMANGQGRLRIKDINAMNGVFRKGEAGSQLKNKEFLAELKKEGIIENDKDVQKIFSRNAAERLGRAFTEGDSTGTASSKPSFLRSAGTEIPRFSSGNRGAGPSSSARP